MTKYLSHTEEIASFIAIFAHKKISGDFDLCAINRNSDYFYELYQDFCTTDYVISRLSELFLNLKRDCDSKFERDFSFVGLLSDKNPESGEVAFNNAVNCYIYFISKKFSNWHEIIFNDSQICKTALVQSNILRVYHFAHIYREKTDLWEDMVQNGVLGIMQAIETFLPWYGHRFGTYATWMIRGALQRHLRNENKFQRFSEFEIDRDPESGITLEHLAVNKENLFHARRERLAQRIRQILEDKIIHQLSEEEKGVLLSDLYDTPLEISDKKRINQIRRKIKHILLNHPDFRNLKEEMGAIDDIEETINIL